MSIMIDSTTYDTDRIDREQPPTGDTCHWCGKTYAELDHYQIGEEWHPFCDERCHMAECEDADFTPPTPPACPVCDAPCEPLGTLGHLNHWRCRGCGMDHSTTSETTYD